MKYEESIFQEVFSSVNFIVTRLWLKIESGFDDTPNPPDKYALFSTFSFSDQAVVFVVTARFI